MNEALNTVLEPKPMMDFVETKYVRDLTNRALTYIEAGFPVHLRGTSGTGKTTLAMHIAGKLGRPMVLLHGDAEHKTGDLVGGEYGYSTKRVVDRYQSRVLKVEENMSRHWSDNRLTVACKYGFTLLYDEFTRSRPEANNVLLSVLQEKIMDLPPARGGNEAYLKVHPNFTALFTSNPEEYAGVSKAQDALRDRMVTMDLDAFDFETEVEITIAKSNIDREDAEDIVSIVRALRESGKCEFAPTVRGSVMIAKTLAVYRNRLHQSGIVQSPDLFLKICQDILASETSRIGTRTNQQEIKDHVRRLVEKSRLYSEGRHLKAVPMPKKEHLAAISSAITMMREAQKSAG